VATTVPPTAPQPVLGQAVTLADGQGNTVQFTMISVDFPTHYGQGQLATCTPPYASPATADPGDRLEAVQYSVKVLSGQWTAPSDWISFYTASGPGPDVPGGSPAPLEGPSFNCVLDNAINGTNAQTPQMGAISGWDIYEVPLGDYISRAEFNVALDGPSVSWGGLPKGS
jgi:hypothetical protein